MLPTLKLCSGRVNLKPDDLIGTDTVGVVNGLAWTSVGGELLKVEAAIMEGAGKLELTGSLGDVMKESAKAACSYIRCHAHEWNIDDQFYKNKDIHIHFPEGAVPKDGPSAGIAVTTALASALSGCPVRADIAMTGEVTLTGRVLPIGGLREKTMAAYKSGLRSVLIPHENLPGPSGDRQGRCRSARICACNGTLPRCCPVRWFCRKKQKR